MTRRRTYPGSIYADKRGLLYIHIFGKRHATGLKNGKAGRQEAERLLISIYERHFGLSGNSEFIPYINDAYTEFDSELINRYTKTKRNYRCAYDAIIRHDFLLSEREVRQEVRNYLNTTEHSKVTIHTYITELQVFLNYCTKKNWLPKIELKKDYKIRAPKAKPQEWHDNEIQKILSYLIKKRHTDLAIMIRFQLLTGARLVDAIGLHWSDIEGNVIKFKNKITKEPEPRHVSTKAIRLLNHLPHNKDKVFRWTTQGTSHLHRILRNACADCGIERNGRSFQEFRLTFRMRLLRTGVPDAFAQHLMRHSTLELTNQIYTVYQLKDMEKFIEKLG